MSVLSKKIGSNVRRIRLEKGFTQSDLCKRLNVDPPYLSNLENGRKNPTIATLEKIAKALTMDPSNLLK